MKTNHRRSPNSQNRGESVSVTQVNVIKLGLDVHADSIRVVRQLDHAPARPEVQSRAISGVGPEASAPGAQSP